MPAPGALIQDLRGSAYDRGRLQAQLNPDRIAEVTVAVTRRLREIGPALAIPKVIGWLDAQHAFMRDNDPDGYVEVQGIAEGFGIAADALFACLYSNVIADLGRAAGAVGFVHSVGGAARRERSRRRQEPRRARRAGRPAVRLPPCGSRVVRTANPLRGQPWRARCVFRWHQHERSRGCRHASRYRRPRRRLATQLPDDADPARMRDGLRSRRPRLPDAACRAAGRCCSETRPVPSPRSSLPITRWPPRSPATPDTSPAPTITSAIACAATIWRPGRHRRPHVACADRHPRSCAACTPAAVRGRCRQVADGASWRQRQRRALPARGRSRHAQTISCAIFDCKSPALHFSFDAPCRGRWLRIEP